jgi:hypothetical protein
MDASAAAVEDASLATSRWCRSMDCRSRVTSWRTLLLLSEPSEPLFLPFPFPLSLPLPLLGLRVGGGGSPEDMAVLAAASVEAVAIVEGGLLLRAQSRIWWHVPRSPSGLA